MKTKMTSYLLVILLLSGLQGMAQITAKGSQQSKKKPAKTTGTLPADQTVFHTTRSEDLNDFDQFQRMFKEAVKTGTTEEAEALRTELVAIARREIARSKKNLQDLEAGITKDLDAWQKENKPGVPINIEMEKTNLKNRINYEQAVLDRLVATDLNNVSNQRDKTSVTGYLDSFKSQMERNLKYGDAMNKQPAPPPPPPKGGGEPLTGPGYSTKKGTTEKIESGDPRLKQWNESQKSMSAEFLKGQSDFQKYLDSGDSKMAKRSWRSLLQLMMNAINSNNWLLGQMNSGNISKSGVDVPALQKKVSKQQGILEKAQKIKVSTPEDLKANTSKAVEVLQQFAGTLK